MRRPLGHGKRKGSGRADNAVRRNEGLITPVSENLKCTCLFGAAVAGRATERPGWVGFGAEDCKYQYFGAGEKDPELCKSVQRREEKVEILIRRSCRYLPGGGHWDGMRGGSGKLIRPKMVKKKRS